jgi:chemotaxis protein methyltransferase CheR
MPATRRLGAAPLVVPPPNAAAAQRPSATDLESELQAAWHAADRGATDAAAAACHRAIAGAPFDPRPYYLLAQLAQESGSLDEARALLNKVLYLDPAAIAAYLDLGALHARAADHEGAQRMRQSARKLLAALPPETPLAIHRDTTAGELLQSLERLLASPGATGSTPADPIHLAPHRDRSRRG